MKTMKYMVLVAVACCSVAVATPITVVNGDFSSPTAKQTTGYANVVGWSDTGTIYTDTGVEASSGDEVAFAMGSDDGAYQILSHSMVEGEQYTLTWDSTVVWAADQETVTLLSATTTGDAFGATTMLASHVGVLVDWTSQSLSYTATAADAGKYIGISFDNTATTGESWAQ